MADDPIRVFPQFDKWTVDFGGGITQTFASRDEAISAAQRTAQTEQRELEIAA